MNIMKRVLIILITFIGVSAFAQKAEVKSAQKLFDKGNLTEAKSMADKAFDLYDQADKKLKAKILFVKGEIYAKLGGKDFSNYQTAVKTLEDLKAYEKEIDRVKYTDDAKNVLVNIENEVSAAAFKMFNDKKYVDAAKYFELVFKLNKNEYYKYSSAFSYLLSEDYKKAEKLFDELYKSNYTGIMEYYTALNKVTNKREKVDEKAGKLLVQAGTYADMKKENSENLRPKIVSNLLYIYGKEGDDTKAMQFIADAKKEDPNNLDLLIGEANYYLKKDNKEKFVETMRKAVAIEPDNKIFNFNMAATLFQMKKYDEAKKYYDKVIALDPNYVDAYKGLVYIQLVPEKIITEELNKDEVLMNDALYNKYRKQQLELYKSVLPSLEKALGIAPEDHDVLVMLKKIYNDLEMKDKFKQVKDKLAELKQK